MRSLVRRAVDVGHSKEVCGDVNVPRRPFIARDVDELRPQPQFWGPSGTGADLEEFGEDDLAGEAPACKVCGVPRCDGVAVVYGYPIWCCSSCGVGFVWPQPPPHVLSAYYGVRYWQKYLGDSRPLEQREAIRSHILLRQAQLVRRLVADPRRDRILDVGTGDGSMLALYRDVGLREPVGLEIDQQLALKVSQRVGCRVVSVQSFSDFREGPWDVISMWALIEHVTDPVAFLRHARSLLTPGGALVVMTGDNSSFHARLQGRFDMWVYPPEHLFYFDRPSLGRLLTRTGPWRMAQVRLGYQHPLKEAVLWCFRAAQAGKERFAGASKPAWRSANSNLLVGIART
ncbi:MAG: class I SAM-dependent methyltransferase [Deltaproteobacteria bacterium]|nr:class I SAM-dependent methyltransferase [Deltaproteobacteria bacterium]